MFTGILFRDKDRPVESMGYHISVMSETEEDIKHAIGDIFSA